MANAIARRCCIPKVGYSLVNSKAIAFAVDHGVRLVHVKAHSIYVITVCTSCSAVPVLSDSCTFNNCVPIAVLISDSSR